MDAELEFAIQSSTTGKELFEQVGIVHLLLKYTNIQKCYYFVNLVMCKIYLNLVKRLV